MTSGRYGLVLREVGRLLGGGTTSGLGANQLLGRFASDRDGAAFEALVTRHGPMVLGTCRRMLSDPHDVDDAFQATFLVLARKAGSIRDADRLGPWLHGVARRVASRSRALSARRRSVERPGGDEPAAESPDLLEGLELRDALDDELSRLPEKYRAPLVLCYLEGLTHDEAAEALRWPVGTVRSRLAGGRDRLRIRLTRRGLAPSAAVPAILTRAQIPQALLSTTVRLATSAGAPSAHVATLAKGALIAMMWGKLKVIAAVGLMAGVTVGGAGVAAQRGGEGPAKPEAPVVEEAPPTLEQVEAEIKRIRAEGSAIEKKIKQLRVEHEQALRPLEKAYEGLNSQEFPLVQRLKELTTNAASTAVDDRIKRLEAELQAARRETQVVQGKLDILATAIARPPLQPATAKVDVSTKPSAPPPTVAPQAPQPIVHPLNVNSLRGGPPLFLVVSAGRDRVTIIDPATKERATFDLHAAATEIVPIVGDGVISLDIRGPRVLRTAIYDLKDKRWYELDNMLIATEVSTVTGGSTRSSGVELIGVSAKGPEFFRVAAFDRQDKKWVVQELTKSAKGSVTPFVTSETVTYHVGRFLYRYSVMARKWSTLELKQQISAPNIDDEAPIQDGDLIYLYDKKTGEWTRIDTRDGQ